MISLPDAKVNFDLEKFTFCLFVFQYELKIGNLQLKVKLEGHNHSLTDTRRIYI